MKTSVDLLNDCILVQQERGRDYDTSNDNGKERSFAATATAFNAITGKDITPAEVCLMLQVLKDVRQWSQDRLHEDSVLDGVSYSSLKGEELYRQYQSQAGKTFPDMHGDSVHLTGLTEDDLK